MSSAAVPGHAEAPRDFALGVAPFTYADLYRVDGLRALYARFETVVAVADPPLVRAVGAWRDGGAAAVGGAQAESALMLSLAQAFSPFIAQLFGVGAAAAALRQRVERHAIIFAFKRDFINKRVRRLRGGPSVDLDLIARLHAALGGGQQGDGVDTGDHADPELRAARCAMAVLALYQTADRRPQAPPEELAAVSARASALLLRPVGMADVRDTLAKLVAQLEAWHASRLTQHPHWVSYQAPHAIDPGHAPGIARVRPERALPEEYAAATPGRGRDGFGLTDTRMGSRQIDDQVDYCLLCHVRGRDSCRHGLRERNGAIKRAPHGHALTGCPLDQRISEAHVLRRQGDQIAALAMIMADNPMCAGTGHRICNDCMKACIFQKQEPVDIPEVETSILSDVLALPYGFEIYCLLTRFNPLNRLRPIPAPVSGHRVLVVGLGPAGYTLAHYLAQEGLGVVAIDGLKLEPLPAALVGEDAWPPAAVRDFSALTQDLAVRAPAGFGGVAEYGITVRWDKNFLKVIYLTLLRRQNVACFGGVRFGGTLSVEDAWALGFDHVALAAGAGRPTIVDMKNNMLRGMRAASDFLMSLQLLGAFGRDALTSLQVRLPAVVVGGGLTAVDTATEVAAYYPVQVERLLRWVQAVGEGAAYGALDAEERRILDEMLKHARELEAARAAGPCDVSALVRRWGGVCIAYRRGLTDSPAYRLNHAELQGALQEGVRFIEHVTPTEALADVDGHVRALRCRRHDGSTIELPARAVMLAAGTAPNTVYARESPGTVALDARQRFFLPHRLSTTPSGVRPVPAEAFEDGALFTSYHGGARRVVSYYGDNHPRYAGSVVRAMASAKHGFAHVVDLLAQTEPAQTLPWADFIATLRDALMARVVRVERLTPTVVEVVVRAPMQARKFSPGQFFRLQNFAGHSQQIGPVRLVMENLALTGAWVDVDAGLIGMVALEMGVSSRLCAHLRPGEPVVLMGPSGSPTEIPSGQTVALCGGGLGNAVLFSVAAALKDRGNRVIYFAAFRRAQDLFRRASIEAHSDVVVYSVDAGPPIATERPQDHSLVGNIVQAMQAVAGCALGTCAIELGEVDRILAIGSDRMMAAIARARQGVLADALKPGHTALASINSPMQCMLKEICAQCLQRHVDPLTGAESFVYSCFNQDQPQDSTDWEHLAARLRQNTVLEKVANLYLDTLLRHPTGDAAPLQAS